MGAEGVEERGELPKVLLELLLPLGLKTDGKNPVPTRTIFYI
jgi:hypothetical protein